MLKAWGRATWRALFGRYGWPFSSIFQRWSNSQPVFQQSHAQTFAYDEIGNITYRSDVGTYAYEGDTGTSYANPHAVTSAGDRDFTYDMNGNMLDSGTVATYSWDWNNLILTTTPKNASLR